MTKFNEGVKELAHRIVKIDNNNQDLMFVLRPLFPLFQLAR